LFQGVTTAQSSVLVSHDETTQPQPGGTRYIDDSEMSSLLRRSNVSDKLETDLRNARFGGLSEHSYFVPISDFNELITASKIEEIILEGHPFLETAEARTYAKNIERDAKKLFAILALQQKGAEICSFWDSGILDRDLPFVIERLDRQWSLKSPKQCSQIFERWKNKEIEEFDRTQWWIIPPIFDKNATTCLRLVDQVILPFSPIDEHMELNRGKSGENDGVITFTKMGGAYSEVNAYHIHPAHHNFWDWDTSLSLVRNLNDSFEVFC
jgi:hypothetical protein